MDKKIIKIYVAFALLFGVSQSFFAATYQLFLQQRGMNFFNMNLINFFFMLTVFILEIPTGAFADAFGRRKSVAFGCFILSGSFLTYYFSHSFWMFVLAEMIGALGATFVSGALEAWVVDALKHHDYDGEMNRVFEREGQFTQIGAIIGVLIGSYVGNLDIALPWLLTSITTGLIGVFSLVFMQEDYRKNKKVDVHLKPLAKIAREGLDYSWGHKGIMYVLIFSVVFSFAVQGLNMQWPFVFKSYGLNVQQNGYVFIGILLTALLGNSLARHWQKKIANDRAALVSLQFITALAIILSSLMFGLPFTLFWFLVHETGRGIFKPLKQTYLNKCIESDHRATILSFESMVTKLGAGIGLLVSGYLANNYSISTSWLVSGTVLALSIPLFMRKNGKN